MDEEKREVNNQNEPLAQADEHNILDDAEVTKMIEQVDRESRIRRLPGKAGLALTLLGVAFTIFAFAQNAILMMPQQVNRAAFLGAVVALGFVLFPPTKKARRDIVPWYDIALAVFGFSAFYYYVINFSAIVAQAGKFAELDMIVAIIGIVLLFELCRRCIGWPIMIVGMVFIAYALFSGSIPGNFGTRGYSLMRVTTHLFYTLEGIIGTPIGVCVSFIFLFILFAAFLEKTGVGRFFIDIANSVAGSAVGGPAKVAVISSALQGMISGSSVANTVGSGSFTIPMMKKMGYKPEFAAAVEAAASTGGQIMPPIMGAAAFLMAEFTGESYARIVAAAVIPAVLYFLGIFLMVHFEAKKLGLKGVPKSELPRFLALMKKQGYLLVPMLIIIIFLVIGYTPGTAALWAITASIIVSLMRKGSPITLLPLGVMSVLIVLDITKMILFNSGVDPLPAFFDFNFLMPSMAIVVIGICVLTCICVKPFRSWLKKYFDALVNTSHNVVSIAVACAVSGTIIGMVTLTGVGLKLAGGLLSLSGGNILLTLFFTMIACLILGMGAPTTANYVIMAAITAPIVVQLGIPVLAAHFFVFYFGIVADITPPVALAAFAGSAIARSNPIKTGVTATRIAITAFIIPYIFALSPELLLINAEPVKTIFTIITAIVGMIGLATGMERFFVRKCHWFESVLLVAAGLMLIIPETVTDIVGISIIGGIFVIQKIQQKNGKVVQNG